MSKKFYPFTVSVNKCGGSSKTIDEPYACVYVPKNVKIVNVKLFNLMSGVMKQDLQFNTNRVRVNVN